MGLTNKYTLAVNRLSDVFAKIRDGQAPRQFNQQLLKDWGFTSSNDRVVLPMLKDLGFLSPDGKPTSRYHDYRDHSRSKAVAHRQHYNASSHHAAPCSGHPEPPERPQRRRAAGPGALPGAETVRL